MRGRGRRIGPALFAVTAAYDGFFGPGTGSFFMMAFVMLAGFGVLQATAHTRMLNLASNLGSLAVRVGARVIKPLLGSPRPGWRCGCCFKRSARVPRVGGVLSG